MFALRSIARKCLVTLLAFSPLMALAGDREAAPRFTARTMTGEKFTNDSLKGKVVLLQFWTTWCPYCHHEQSIVDDIQKEFASQGLVVLAIDVGESKKTVKKYLENSPRACPIVLTDDTNLAAMFAAKSYPIYVVIDREGNVVDTQHGAGGDRPLRNMLRRAGLKLDEED
jgi:thiol-disulfide isomerase/thioredoxin